MKFFSQVGQDRFLLENYFRGKRDGVFVDVGAYDGEKFSNSLFFERFMGWTGLCIEPQPAAFRKLAASRKARCLQLASPISRARPISSNVMPGRTKPCSAASLPVSTPAMRSG